MIPGFLIRKDEPKFLFVFRIIGMILLGLTIAVVFAFLFGYFVMILWNWLMPMLFGLKLITFWQAVGIIILAKLVFGGFGHGRNHWKHNHHGHWQRHNYGHRCDRWQYYEEYWKEEGEKAFNSYVERKYPENSK